MSTTLHPVKIKNLLSSLTADEVFIIQSFRRIAPKDRDLLQRFIPAMAARCAKEKARPAMKLVKGGA